jgi:hypothetical protein
LATLLDPVEEPSDPVAGAVAISAEADRIVGITFRWDVGHWRRYRRKVDINRLTIPVESVGSDPSAWTGRALQAKSAEWR